MVSQIIFSPFINEAILFGGVYDIGHEILAAHA